MDSARMIGEKMAQAAENDERERREAMEIGLARAAKIATRVFGTAVCRDNPDVVFELFDRMVVDELGPAEEADLDERLAADLLDAKGRAAKIFGELDALVSPDRVLGVYDRVMVVDDDGDDDEGEDAELVRGALAETLRELGKKWRRKVSGMTSAAHAAKVECAEEAEALADDIEADVEDDEE